MQIQVTTDNHITSDQQLRDEVTQVVEDALTRYSERITRVEVHLSDENSRARGGDNDKRCMMEARPRGMQPIAVTHQDSTVSQAVSGAAAKLAKTLGRTWERLDDPKGRTSFGGDQAI